jgi:hypothetical protein
MYKKLTRGSLSMAPIVTGAIVIILIIITALNYYYRPKIYTAELIVKDLITLQQIFKKIDDRCKILGFDYPINPINFLNVGTFKSSEVGPMNLTYPKQWQGPYLNENPRIQGKEYQIVKTKKGLFITPGNGVVLPNGKVIGKDIQLNENTDIQALTQNNKALRYDSKELAILLPVGYSAFAKAMLDGAADVDIDMLGA